MDFSQLQLDLQIVPLLLCVRGKYDLNAKIINQNVEPNIACMNITPRIKSARNKNNLIVNVSIEIPLKQKMPVSHRSQQTSLSPSPNRLKKRFKLVSSNFIEKRTVNTSNAVTLREGTEGPSRKKYSNPTPTTTANPSSKVTMNKFRSCELSPKRKGTGKKGKSKVRNVSILEQVIGEDDIIKYTSNSNELRDKAEDLLLLENLARKIDTHVSEIDILQIRNIERTARYSRDTRQKVCLRRVQELLRTACAKKIQRAWRNYKTKKLIKSYSNDIRSRYHREMHISNDPTATSRSQGTGLRFKKKLLSYDQIVASQEKEKQKEQLSRGEEVEGDKSGRSGRMLKKIQEDNMEKWQGLIQQIKNKKNINAALEFSIQRTKELTEQLGKQFFKETQPQPVLPVQPEPSPQSTPETKIIKTKKYYQGQREKWRQSVQRSNGSINREKRVNYFENQMLRLQNDYSDSADSSLSQSVDLQGGRNQQQMQNFKLRKKLEVFRNHLPEVQPFQPPQNANCSINTQSNRVDIATIIKKKNESLLEKVKQTIQHKEKRQFIEKETIKQQNMLPNNKQIQIIQFDLHDENIEKSPSNSYSQSLIETHRQWRPLLKLEQKQEDGAWKQKLRQTIKKQQQQLNHLILQELILESLIEVSQSERLIAFIKGIHDRIKGHIVKKAQGIVTNHSSIKDYISYFISYLFENKVDALVLKNLLSPLGPTPRDVLRYFRGEEMTYDPQSEYVMGIRIFNAHWQYANELIYFDRKWQDEKKEAERVNYLKQLTKVFFRVIFDCFNESLQGLRIYGQRGKPYPWSQQRLKVETPDLNKCLGIAFQRVLRYSLVFAGVLFQDKKHSLDEGGMSQIQEANMVKFLTIELQDDENLWLFLEDQLAEIKLQLARHVQQMLLKEISNMLAVVGWR